MKKGKSLSDWMVSARSNLELTSLNVTTGTTSQSKRISSLKKKPPSGTRRKTEDELKNCECVSSAEQDKSWIEKYRPKVQNDLAVHKKKILEVQQWLQFALSPHSSHKPVLLLTGPAGCGKTASLCVLATEMDFMILEWVNPVSDSRETFHKGTAPGDQVIQRESQVKQFQNFVLRANRYPSLTLTLGGGGEKGGGASAAVVMSKVVLVEEFPNAFLRDPDKFPLALESLRHCLRYPLVLVASESHHSGCSASNIFRKDRIAKMGIHTISFNPVSHTSLVKTLLHIASMECKSGAPNFHMPPREVVEVLAASSNGDIRSAVNSLQVICLRASSDLVRMDNFIQKKCHTKSSSSSLSGSKSSSKSASAGSKLWKRTSSNSSDVSTEEMSGIGVRDNPLFLFRALGKILYCKRDAEQGVVETLPPHLKEHERSPLLVSPERVVENTHLSSDMFALYLHENFVDFFDDLQDISNALDYLSNSDVIGQLWSDSKEVKLSLERCSSSVACRGIMHCNRSRAGGKWRPLHKPRWTSVYKQHKDNSSLARSQLLHLGASPYAHLWTLLELQTDIIPYMGIINMRLRNTDQVAFLQSVAHFKSSAARHLCQVLGEKDVEMQQTSLSLETQVTAGTEDPALSQEVKSPSMLAMACLQQRLTPSQNSRILSLEEGSSLEVQGDDIEEFEDDIL